ncbi:MAG: hypothetical protein E6Q55_23165 [Mycolicibacterium mageritense]|uniref:Uncharacterized protein n=1 Tax=Mycolicibacterium mageritense TaxID=53462 RepID=A0ABN5YBS9_MYCME|nr:MAG: hypothetical protein E6Q55_23165 [Mycolicibacterium mageritense]BBX35604.1 hypothetical protein MMAGJ_48860 [Mycolicibacterium mageritense]
MDSNINFSGVAVAVMPSYLRSVAVAAHPLPKLPTAHASGAAWPAAAAAAIAPQRKRRPAAATGASVDRSPI